MIRRFAPLALVTCVCLARSGSVRAEPTATQKATAETLFQRGVELSESGQLTEACSQFDASLQIDPALGTLFRLADCYDRVGRSASAWALFSEAQARAKGAEQPARERIAAERVADLERRLSKLSLNLGSNATLPGVELRMNDVIVPSASWGVALPVDPGPQRLRLSAPGHREWEGTVTVEKGPSTRELTLSALALAPAPVEKTAAPASLQPRALPKADSAPYPAWLGYAVGGAGVLSVGVASVLGYRAYDLNQQSLDECSSVNANACTRRGDTLRDDARRAGLTSTVFAVAGGALLAGGITLVMLRPARRTTEAAALRLTTNASPQSAFASVAGSF